MATTIDLSHAWKNHLMALQEIEERMQRVTQAFRQAGIPYALVGGQAVASWVSTIDPSATRTTKDVDILVRRDDLPRIRAATIACDMEYFEVQSVGMLLERLNPNPEHAVHFVWSGEKVRSTYILAAPLVEQSSQLSSGLCVINLPDLVAMKLQANRDHDRVHLRDMIEVGLISREFLKDLPPELSSRLDALLTEAGR